MATQRQIEARKAFASRYAGLTKTYELIPYGSTKEEYITTIRRIANVANTRYRSLVKAENAKEISLDRTAVKRYYSAVTTFNRQTGKNLDYLPRGINVYSKLSVAKLRQIERDIVHFLEAESSTVTGAKAVFNRSTAFLEDLGIDRNKMSSSEIGTIFRLHHIRKTKMEESKFASTQELRELFSAHETTSFEKIMHIVEETPLVFDNNNDRGDFIINLVRASKLPKAERIKAYKEGLRIKHMKDPVKPKGIKQERAW